MTALDHDYQRIAKAISFLATHIQQQPTLEQVAAHVNLSVFHFQRLFCQWAGITPKRFLQVMTLDQAKRLIMEGASLPEASEQSGLSSPSRLYDHFVTLEAVTPGQFKQSGTDLVIDYGICKAAFIDHNVSDHRLEDELQTLQHE